MNYTWDWEPRCQQPWMESTVCYFLVRLKAAYQWMWPYLSEKTQLGPTAPNWISQLPLPLCLHPSLSARCQPVTQAHVLFEAPGVRKSSPWLYPHSWMSPGDGCFVLVCPVIWQGLRVPFALGGILPMSAHHLDAWEPEKPSLSVQRKLRLWEGTWLLQGHIVRQLGPVLCPHPPPTPGQGSSGAMPCPLLLTPIHGFLKLPALSLFPISPCSPISLAHDPSGFPSDSPARLHHSSHCYQNPRAPLPSHCTLLAKPWAGIIQLLPFAVPHPWGCLAGTAHDSL